MKGLAIFGMALLAAPGAHAMDVASATDFLQGAWSGGSETFIFEGQSWTQFFGGVQSETTYSVEALPENLFVVISDLTGKRYVVHTTKFLNSMTWFEEGSTEQAGFYQRRSAD